MDVDKDSACSTLSDTEAKERITKWANESDSLTILVFGKTGSGKSSLINTLFDKEVAEECPSITPGTKYAEPHREEKEEIKLRHTQITICNIKITLWDTPGLREPLARGRIVSEIKEKCKDRLDLFLYCSDISQKKITDDDFSAIQELTDALGKDIWQNTVFALTFVNELNLPHNCQKTLDVYLESRVQEWRRELRRAMASAGVPEKETELVPFVPASYRKLPLPTSHGPDSEEWLETFWSGCVCQVRFSSLPAMLQIKISRPVYTGARLIAIGDSLLEQMKAEKNSKDLEKWGLTGVSPEQIVQFLTEAFAVRTEPLSNDQVDHSAASPSVWTRWSSIITAGVGVAAVAFMMWKKYT